MKDRNLPVAQAKILEGAVVTKVDVDEKASEGGLMITAIKNGIIIKVYFGYNDLGIWIKNIHKKGK